MNGIRFTSAVGTAFEMDGPDTFVGTALDMFANVFKVELGANSLKSSSRKAREGELSASFMSLDAVSHACAVMDEGMDSPGTFEVNGWTQKGHVTSIVPTERRRGKVWATVGIVLLDGVWRKSTVYHLRPSSGLPVSTGGLDYPHDYPHDYQMANSLGVPVHVDSPSGALVRLTFFGPCNSPYVHLAGNVYGVNDSIADGHIVIDPLGRHREGESVYSVGQWGVHNNLFAKRKRGAAGSGSYVFERVPQGDHTASWPQTYGVDLEVLEESGMPPWS